MVQIRPKVLTGLVTFSVAAAALGMPAQAMGLPAAGVSENEETGIIFTEMISQFGNVLKDNLRKSDIIIQWQQNRYFVVLPLLTEKDKPAIIDRIMGKWKDCGYYERINVKYTSNTLVK